MNNNEDGRQRDSFPVFYKPAEVCAILKISQPTLWRLGRLGLKKIKIAGVVRYRKSDVDDFLGGDGGGHI